MSLQKNVVGWFEIPVSDMERAIKFYETVFNLRLARHKMEQLDMAWFPMVENGIGSMGALVFNKDFYKPSPTDGVLIYFSSQTNNISDELSRVEQAGGTISIPRRQIAPDIGYMAVIIDSEGNRIALHSRG